MKHYKLQFPSHFPNVINWSKSAQLYLGLIGCFTAWLILYSCVNAPINKHLKSNAAAITRLTKELHIQQQHLVTKKSTYQRQTAILNKSLLHKSHPQGLTHFLAQLITLANEQHLEFDTIKPLSPEVTQGLSMQPIQISTSGHYQTLLSFLTRLPGVDAINTLGDFDLQPLPAITDTRTHEHILKLTLIINLFTKNLSALND